MITQETIDRIFAAVRIEEVIGDVVKLKKRGVNLLGNCPFHNEKTPSFTVSPAKGIYKCFGCAKAGNAVGFVMDHDQVSYPEALRILAKRYNIEIEETEQPQEMIEQRNERESLYILMAAAQKYYTGQLLETEEGRNIALSYLKERGLTMPTIESFGLGWSPAGWNTFSDWAIVQGFQKEYLVRTGVCYEKEDGRLVDRFRERIMFPIHNVSGKIVGFGGRILRSTGKEAKYINSPETEIYNKSQILYGLYQGRKGVRQVDSALIVEGYMDVLALHQAGIENAVASSGTSLTVDQLRLIKRFSENVTMLFDGDAAGQKAALRSIDLALEQSMNVRLVSLPAEHDPDSFAKAHSQEEVETYLRENSENFIAFRARLLPQDILRDPIRKAGAVKEMLESLMLIDDSLKRNLLLKEVEKHMQMDEQVLFDELRRLYVQKFRKSSREESAPGPRTGFSSGPGPGPDEGPPPDFWADEPFDPSAPPAPQQPAIQADRFSSIRQEKEILKNILLYGDKETPEQTTVLRFILQELEEVEWEDEQCSKLFEIFKKAADENPFEPLNLTQAIPQDDTAMQAFISSLMAERHSLSENWKRFLGRDITKPADNFKEEVVSAIKHFMLRKVMRLIRANQTDMKTAAGDDIETLLAVQIFLNERKKEIVGTGGAALVE